jgi:dTMP kinase
MLHARRKGILITFEGSDGCGKTTQAKALYRYLRRKGYDVIFTREPGGTKLGSKLRKILLSPETKITPYTELLLNLADRAQHVEEVILPALKENKIVISDRFSDATVSYQGYGRGIPLNIIDKLNNLVTQNIKPDLTILLFSKDAKAHTQSHRFDRYESESDRFKKLVNKGYRELAKKEKKRIIEVLREEKIGDTTKKIINIVTKFLAKNYHIEK